MLRFLPFVGAARPFPVDRSSTECAYGRSRLSAIRILMARGDPYRLRCVIVLELAAIRRRLLLVLAPLLAQARIGIRFASVPALRRLTLWGSPRSSLRPERLAELLNVASQRLPGFTPCLPRAIVLEGLLRKAGLPAELKVGIAPLRGASRPDAHAWVELDGAPVGETAAGYTAVPVFGTRG